MRTFEKPLVAVDWAGNKPLTYCTNGRDAYEFNGTLSKLAETWTSPRTLVVENTFESYPGDRDAVVAHIRSLGHDVLTFRPTHTSRKRKEWGLDKSDANDAVVIFRIAAETDMHLPIPHPQDDDWAARSDELRDEWMRARRTSLKEEYFERALGLLPSWKDMDETLKRSLGANGYSKLVAVLLFAAENTHSRKEFEHLLGLHGSAHPTIFRSEVFHWGFRRSAMKRDVSLSEFRRTIRTIRRMLLNELAKQGTQGPASGLGTY